MTRPRSEPVGLRYLYSLRLTTTTLTPVSDIRVKMKPCWTCPTNHLVIPADQIHNDIGRQL
jgi:hypothetical protein